MFNRRGLT
ncbi:hypothetical protein YPPY71_2381, partial [Yersinia pestis PY-71]